MTDAPERLMRRKEVQDLCGISAAMIYKLMDAGDFPKPMRIGERAVRWRLSEVNAWIAAQTPEAA